VQKAHDQLMLGLKKLPLVKALYDALSSLVTFLTGAEKSTAGQPVIVEVTGVHILGVVTRRNTNNLDSALKGKT
jgi:uncharacterized membrane protein